MSQTQNHNRTPENDEHAYGRENERTRWGSPSQLDPQLFGGRVGGGGERGFRLPFGAANPQSFDTRETVGRVLGRALGDRETDPRQAVVERLSGIEQERQSLIALLALVTGAPNQTYQGFAGTPEILRNIDPRAFAQLAGWQENHPRNQAPQNSPRHERHRNVRITTKGLNRDDNLVKDEVISSITYLIQHGRIDQDDLIEIDVKVKDGDVTLAGTVTNRDVKLYIEETVGNVIGVKDIRNELRFVPIAHEGNSQRAQPRDPRQPHAS
jgi:BON domain